MWTSVRRKNFFENISGILITTAAGGDKGKEKRDLTWFSNNGGNEQSLANYKCIGIGHEI